MQACSLQGCWSNSWLGIKLFNYMLTGNRQMEWCKSWSFIYMSTVDCSWCLRYLTVIYILFCLQDHTLKFRYWRQLVRKSFAYIFILSVVRITISLSRFNIDFDCEAGLVGIIVLRDVALVGGAIYNRASSLLWNVSCSYLNRSILYPVARIFLCTALRI